MNSSNSIAYCGIYCGACKIYISNQNNALEQLSKITGVPVELLHCDGCRSDINSLYCRNCAMKKCTLKKGLFSCGDCDEFPCSVLKAFESDQHPHHKGVIDNLKLLNKVGKEKWLEAQTERWSCPGCEEAYSWYELKCTKCNEKINGLDPVEYQS